MIKTEKAQEIAIEITKIARDSGASDPFATALAVVEALMLDPEKPSAGMGKSFNESLKLVHRAVKDEELKRRAHVASETAG